MHKPQLRLLSIFLRRLSLQIPLLCHAQRRSKVLLRRQIESSADMITPISEQVDKVLAGEVTSNETLTQLYDVHLDDLFDVEVLGFKLVESTISQLEHLSAHVGHNVIEDFVSKKQDKLVD